MNHVFYILLLFITFQIAATAQSKPKIINTAEGKMIVYPDGRTEPFSLSSENPNSKVENKASGIENYPIFNAEITPLDNPISVTEEDLAKIAFRRSQISRQAAEIAEARANKAIQKKEALTLKMRNTENAKEREKLVLELDNAQKIEEEALQELNQARSIAQEAEFFAKGGNYVESFIKEREARERAFAYSKVEQNNTSIGLPLPFGESYASPVTSNQPLKKMCRVNFDGTDESTGRWRKDLKPAPLFSFTDDRLRTYLKDQEYLQCEGFLSTTNGFTSLTLDFTFAYPNAREAYGIIEEGSILTIKLLDGHYINLLSGNMDEGSYDLETQQLTYEVTYMIDRGQMNILKRSEVDVILVFWSTGFEEYPVYQMDFFKNQFACLED